MTSRFRIRWGVAAVGIVAVIVIGGLALSAQGTPSQSDTLGALLAEVRALRTELSEATRISVRSQLLTARLQLQEQRLMHLDRQRSDVTTKRMDVERFRTLFAGQLKQLEGSERSPDPGEREGAQRALDPMKAQLQAAQASETTLRGEEQALLTAIAEEQARWTDFNNRLDELERSLPSRR